MLYEKMPLGFRTPFEHMAEVPYGFKNLWLIDVSSYDLGTRTFTKDSVNTVLLNGSPVSVDQLIHLYDYSRDTSGLTQPGISGILVSISDFDRDLETFTFYLLTASDINVTGVLGISGDMVDNTDPNRPVILHDTQKLDISQYTSDQEVLDARLTQDESNIANLQTGVSDLQSGSLIGVSLNGTPTTVTNNVAEITLDYVTPVDLDSGLNTKIDKTFSPSLVTSVTSSFDPSSKTLTLTNTSVNPSTGTPTTVSIPYALATLLGVDQLEAIDQEHFYFYDSSSLPSLGTIVDVPLAGLFRFNADGSKFVPTSTEGIALIFALSTDYSDFNVESRKYISSIGEVLSYTPIVLSTSFTNLSQLLIYNQYNFYRAGALVYSQNLNATFYVLQNVARPTTPSEVIPLTNELYFQAIKDYSPMDPATVFANFETIAGAGQAYSVERTRLELLKVASGYTDYVSFKLPTIPPQIVTDTDWDTNIDLWVTDGFQFTSRNALITYLSNFLTGAERFKISNRGIIRTQYTAGGITINPTFTSTTIAQDLAGTFQPIPNPAPTPPDQVSIYDAQGILVPSGKVLSDFATSAQGALADSAVQSVQLAPGPSPGTLELTVDGSSSTSEVAGLQDAAYHLASDFATSTQGTLADSAIQTAALQSGGSNGTLSLVVNGTAGPDVNITGLKSAAYTESTDYATAAQGALADSSIQTLAITTGTTPGTIQYGVNGGATSEVAVTGLGSAAYSSSSAFATAAQGLLADTALQHSDVVDNATSTDPQAPVSANQVRILAQQIQTISDLGRRIGGFPTYADRYLTTSQYASDLQPIVVGDVIYIAADETHTNEPALWSVSSIDGSGNIAYAFEKLVPDTARDFSLNPIGPNEIADGAVNTVHLQNLSVANQDIAMGAVTANKLSTDVLGSLSKADQAILGPIVSTGVGPLVKGVQINAGGALEVSHGSLDSVMSLTITGSGDFLTGGALTSNRVELQRSGIAITGVASTGTGNVISNITSQGRNLNVTRGTVVASITKVGSGNAIVDISSSGSATMGTLLKSITKSGTGNVLTDIQTNYQGEVIVSSTDALVSVQTQGSGNFIASLSTSGGQLVATRGQAITTLPQASTTQAGIVQLDNVLTSSATDRALTSAQGLELATRISSLDSSVVKLTGNQTIYDVKIFEMAPEIPSATTVPVNPSSTRPATESQVFTRIAKPATAAINTVAVFDANRNIISSGIPYTSLEYIPISDAEIDNAFNLVFGV